MLHLCASLTLCLCKQYDYETLLSDIEEVLDCPIEEALIPFWW